ncbi:hypothetical protein EDD16DRAFT_1728839 [Pisolithus croceorrhizus]|nr:hypothetical protein EDD16DRAFT_1728839 [Pisolithus croceorrhizus]
MPKGERRDAKMSEMCDPGLVTLLRHENPNNSTTTNARATSRISSGRCRLGDARLQEANDSARNCMSYGQSEVGARRAASQGDGDARGELGERGIGEKCAPVPEISAKLSHTLLSTEKTHISTSIERVGTKRVSPGLKRGRRWEDGIASMGNRWVEFYETSGGDSDVRGELGDRGNRENGAPNPEIFAKRCDPACLPRNHGIFGCARAAVTKSIPFERHRRVHPESRFARGTDEWSSRYRVTEKGINTIKDPNGLKQPPVDSLEPVQRPRLTPGYCEMTECPGWWAGPEWAHPSNFLSRESGLRGLLEYEYKHGLSRLREREGGSGLRGLLEYEYEHGSSRSRGREGGSGLRGLLEYEYECGSSRSREREGGRPRESDVGTAREGVLRDDSALPLRVVHTTVVPRGGEGALLSGAETHLVEPFGSAAFDYPHPPRIPAIQTVLESAPGYFSQYLSSPRYFLHESQFARIWPFWPQKKQNEYVRQGEQLAEPASKVQNEGNSGLA